MGTFSKYTCHNCQIRRPANYMKQIEVRRKSGQSGWGVSINKKGKFSGARAPRNYYSINKKWVCADKDACDHPNYYIELEAQLAAEQAERERLKKIEEQKTETKSLIKKKMESFLLPAKLARRALVLKPLLEQIELQTALSELKEKFGDKMRIVSEKVIISEIIRHGKLEPDYGWSDDLIGLKGIYQTSDVDKDEVFKKLFSVGKNKPIDDGLTLFGREFHLHWFFNLLLRLFMFMLITWPWFIITILTLGLNILIVRKIKWLRFQGMVGIDKHDIYKKEIKKIAKLVERHLDLNSLFKNMIEHIKSDKALTSLPYFKDCRPEIIDEHTWNSVTTKETATDSKSSELQTLQEIYESDEFFEICIFFLMYAVASADGKVTEDEIHTIKSKFGISENSTTLVRDLTENYEIRNNESYDEAFLRATEQIIKIMSTLFSGNTKVLEMVINNLMTLAEADGEVSESEIKAIHSIGKKLGLSKKSIQNIIDNQRSSDDEDENVRYFDEEFFPDFEEVMG